MTDPGRGRAADGRALFRRARGLALAFVRTLAEARATLAAQRCDLVAIGVYFDDSQMFDLVRAIRADDFQNEVPIVCVRGSPGSPR